MVAEHRRFSLAAGTYVLFVSRGARPIGAKLGWIANVELASCLLLLVHRRDACHVMLLSCNPK